MEDIEKILGDNNIVSDETSLNVLNQHFIIDKDLLQRIVDASHVTSQDVVLEIGAGIGNLTDNIASRARFVYSIELDSKFKPILDKLAEKHSNLMMIYGNALKIEWPKFNKIVSAIPYNIAEPLLLNLIGKEFESCTLVVSKHFADLITSENESRLSVIVPAFFKVSLLEVIPASLFYPVPRYDSALICIRPIDHERLVQNPIKYLIGEIFKRRYSKVKNALRDAMIVWTAKIKGKILTKRKSKEFISYLHLEQTILEKPVNNLSGEDFRFLADSLGKRVDGIYSYCEQ